MNRQQTLAVVGVISLILVGLYVHTVIQQRSAADEVRKLREEFLEAHKQSQEEIRRLKVLLREQEKLSDEQKRELERLRQNSPWGPGDFPSAKPRPFIDPSKNAPRQE